MNIEFEKVTECPNCNSNKFHIIGSVKQYEYEVNYAECHECSLVFQTTRIKDTDEYYRKYYRKLLFNDERPIKTELLFQWNRAELISTYLLKNIEHIDSCLDIGCSSGVLLDMLRDLYKCEVEGVELDVEYSSFARETYKLNIYETLDEINRQYDLITLVHVLEHYKNPHALLDRCKELLLNDGLLYIQVPDILYKHNSTFNLHHTMAFNRKSLNNMLERAGWVVLADIKPCEHISVICEKL